MTKIDKIIKIDNSANDKEVSFVPYGQNFTYEVKAGETFEFKTNNPSAAFYYSVQKIEGAEVGTQESFDGDVTIYTITTEVTNGTYEGDTTLNVGGTATVTVSANQEYKLPATITVNGADYTYDAETGIIVLSNPTDNVTITVVCEAEPAGLTPFVVGDTPTEYGVDTGAKTAQEMNEWLASLTYDGYFSYLVQSTPQGADEVSFTIYAVHKDSLYVLLAMANFTDGDGGTLLYANESHQADDFLPIAFDAGWQVQNGVRPIDNDMLGTISTISDEFATINGVIIGAIVAE